MNFWKWNPRGKSDWLIFILIGVLLMIVVLPTGKDTGGKDEEDIAADKRTAEGNVAETKKEDTVSDPDQYVKKMELRLAKTLSRIRGAGGVSVMITLSDQGEDIIDKNVKRAEKSFSEDSVMEEGGDLSRPYVKGRQVPAVEGVVVIAEGAKDPQVAERLAESVLALFPVASHRVKVMPG